MAEALDVSNALTVLASRIQTCQPETVMDVHVAHGELTLVVPPALMEFFKADTACRFSSLVDIAAIDHPTREARFDLVYHLLSIVPEPAHPSDVAGARGRKAEARRL